MAIASGGGHWVQMRRIMPAFAGLEVFYVSVDLSSAADVPGLGTDDAIRDVSRRDRLGFAVLIAQLVRILARERPNVVITTGSAPCLFALGWPEASSCAPRRSGSTRSPMRSGFPPRACRRAEWPMSGSRSGSTSPALAALTTGAAVRA